MTKNKVMYNFYSIFKKQAEKYKLLLIFAAVLIIPQINCAMEIYRIAAKCLIGSWWCITDYTFYKTNETVECHSSFVTPNSNIVCGSISDTETDNIDHYFYSMPPTPPTQENMHLD